MKKVPFMGQGEINYVGWLGHENIGDQALYVSVQKSFNMYRLVPYIGNQYSQILLVGGGTLLPNDVTMVKPSKYNYVFGAGVKNPSYWGVRHIHFDPRVLERLKSFKFRFLGVRGNISRDLLKTWGINSEVIGDPCLSLKANADVKRNDKKIAISIGSDGLVWGGDEERALRQIAKVCKILKKDGYHPILIPFWRNNLQVINRLSMAENIHVFNNWFDIKSVLNLIASCKILIGEKLHSLVFSAAAYTPFICLEYRPKCFDFAETVGYAKHCIRTDKITAERIMMMFEGLINNWQEMHNELVTKVNMYRKKQKEFATRIIADIESLPNDKWLTPSIVEKLKKKIFWDMDILLHRNMSNIWRTWDRLFFRHIMRYLT